MTAITYTYEIINVDEAARCMEVVYTSPGRQTMHIGARLPYEGETLEQIVEMFSPVAYWRERERATIPVQTGMSGQKTDAPPPPPTPEQLRTLMRLTFPQVLFGLVSEQWITQAEGDAWLVDRTLPAGVEALLSQLPADQQLLARARALQPTEVVRLDPLVIALGNAQGKTSEEIDTFFTTYAQV